MGALPSYLKKQLNSDLVMFTCIKNLYLYRVNEDNVFKRKATSFDFHESE